MERSLSDNKNTVTAERSLLSDEAIIGLRRMKERARSSGGAHRVNTSRKEVINSIKNVHHMYVTRKREEEAKLDREQQQKEEAVKKIVQEKDALKKAEKERIS